MCDNCSNFVLLSMTIELM